MRKYILATHGKMAGGMQSTLEMIAGEQENLTCINAYTDECKDPMPVFQKVIADCKPEDDIVIMTDLLGGSVNNNAMTLIENDHVHVVTGINLPAIISLVMSDEETPTVEAIKEAIESAREMLQYCNELSLNPQEEEEDF